VGRAITALHVGNLLCDIGFLGAKVAHGVVGAVCGGNGLSAVANVRQQTILGVLLGVLRARLGEGALNLSQLLFHEADALRRQQVGTRPIGLNRGLLAFDLKLQLVEPVLQPVIRLLRGVVPGFRQRPQVDVCEAVRHRGRLHGRLRFRCYFDDIAQAAPAHFERLAHGHDQIVRDSRVGRQVGLRGGERIARHHRRAASVRKHPRRPHSEAAPGPQDSAGAASAGVGSAHCGSSARFSSFARCAASHGDSRTSISVSTTAASSRALGPCFSGTIWSAVGLMTSRAVAVYRGVCESVRAAPIAATPTKTAADRAPAPQKLLPDISKRRRRSLVRRHGGIADRLAHRRRLLDSHLVLRPSRRRRVRRCIAHTVFLRTDIGSPTIGCSRLAEPVTQTLQADARARHTHHTNIRPRIHGRAVSIREWAR
jgi:hypothetical protein